MSSEHQELRDRIEARKKKIEARLATLRADTRATAREEKRKLEERLHRLNDHLKEGWSKMSSAVARKLNDWLKED